MHIRLLIAAPFAALMPSPVWAGPPFMTDDAAPTEPGHWEIYAPVVEIAGRGRDFEGEASAEINYGAAPGLQLAVAVPAAFRHDAGGWQKGAGDVEVGAKYRFYNDEATGLSVAAYPSATLPTASNDLGAGQVTGFLPIWLEKDSGRWSVFGGGGYTVNPGAGNRDFWTGSVAVTREFGERWTIGVEANREGSAAAGEPGSTSLGSGAIYHLRAPLSLLVSGGPTFEDRGGAAGFHAFVALGLDL